MRRIADLRRCYNCQALQLLLSNDRSWSFCFGCHASCRIKSGTQIYDPRGREILVRELALGVRPAD